MLIIYYTIRHLSLTAAKLIVYSSNIFLQTNNWKYRKALLLKKKHIRSKCFVFYVWNQYKGINTNYLFCFVLLSKLSIINKCKIDVSPLKVY